MRRASLWVLCALFATCSAPPPWHDAAPAESVARASEWIWSTAEPGRAERCRHVDGRRLWLGDGDHLVLRLLLLLGRHDGGDDLLLLLLLGLHERPLVAVDRLKQPSIDRVKQGAPRSRTTPVCHDH